MKARPLALLLMLPLVSFAAGVKPGATIDEVRATLGVPRGQVQAGERNVLYYDRGEVELTAGTVTRVSLLNDKEYAMREARRAAIAERVREENASRTAAGEALKARLLASTAFRNAPLTYQVAYWEDFSRRYPGVSCAEELTVARMSLAVLLEENRVRAGQEEARVAEMEARAEADESGAARMAFYGYPTRTRYHAYRGSAPSIFPIEYKFFGYEIPVAASPGSLIGNPNYRVASPVNDSSTYDWRNRSGRGSSRNFDRGFGGSRSRNRM